MATPTDVTTAPEVSRWRRMSGAVFTSGNVLAGISVGAYLIPQAMAYGQLAGIDAATGLAVAAVPLIVYMILGRSTHMSLGPESTVALMAAAAVGPVAAATGIPVLNALAITSLLTGVILFAGWLLKASFLADLLSKPILVGYLTGVAILMMLSQLPKMLGYDVDTSSLVGLWQTDWQVPNWYTLTIALVVAAISLGLRFVSKKIPGPLIGLIVAILLGLMWDVPKVGTVTLSLPTPQLSAITLDAISVLMVPALSIAVVSYTDVMVTSRAFAERVPPDPGDEMRALAGVQAATGLTGGYPMSASSSRTALAVAAGANTKFYSVFVLIVLLAGPLLIPGVIAAVPIAGLAGVILFAAITLIEPKEWAALLRFRKRETTIAAVCTISVIVFGILPGVIISIALSIAEFMARLARPHDGVLGFVPDVAGMHDVDDHARTETIPGLVVFRYDAPLFFLNAYDFYNKVDAAAPDGTEVLILNMEANVELDSTALSMLEELHNTLEARGTELWLARVKNDVLEPMRDHGVAAIIGEQNMYPTLPTAVAAYRERFPDEVEPSGGPSDTGSAPTVAPDSATDSAAGQ
ncbi:MAG: SulP family inorganic anion transporter [Candidatus Nanopelagicales bacterium]